MQTIQLQVHFIVLLLSAFKLKSTMVETQDIDIVILYPLNAVIGKHAFNAARKLMSRRGSITKNTYFNQLSNA